MKFVILKMMKNRLLFLWVLLFCKALPAQMNSGIKFDKLIHDFGKVKEDDEQVYATFTFRNVSTIPVYIRKVETSCGCTDKDYTKDTLMPGDTGYVTAIYGTRGRVGLFHKNIYVYFNESEFYQSLEIRGNVVQEPNLARRPAQFSTLYANLAFDESVAVVREITKSEKKQARMRAYNYSGYAIRIYGIKEKPDFVEVDLGDSMLDIDDSITFTFKVDGSKIPQFGTSYSRIIIITDDPKGEEKYLYLNTTLKEDFSKMSAKERRNAPRLEIDNPGPLNMGTHHAGEKFKEVVRITNTGKTDLVLREIKPSCSCITFAIATKVIKPGETVLLTITVDSVNQTVADLTKYLTIHTNDPEHTEVKIKLTMTIIN